MSTYRSDAPRPGEFCDRHWSWLCQAGQGECDIPATTETTPTPAAPSRRAEVNGEG